MAGISEENSGSASEEVKVLIESRRKVIPVNFRKLVGFFEVIKVPGAFDDNNEDSVEQTGDGE